MKKEDRQVVEAADEHDDIIKSLVRIIDRLDKQLAGVKEVGEPLQRLFEEYSPPQSHDDRYYFTPIEKAARHVAQKLKEIDHD